MGGQGGIGAYRPFAPSFEFERTLNDTISRFLGISLYISPDILLFFAIHVSRRYLCVTSARSCIVRLCLLSVCTCDLLVVDARCKAHSSAVAIVVDRVPWS